MIEIGQKFCRVTVLSLDRKDNHHRRYWNVRCDCGKEWSCRQDGLVKGMVKSCGCLRTDMAVDRLKTHGRSFTPEYVTWGSMIQRCTNPKAPAYKHYGGRGITVCETWESFDNFYADMGDRPLGTSLERRENHLGYSKDNCRWATQAEQMANTRRTKLVVLHGQTVTLEAARKALGLGPGTIQNHIKTKGASPQEAVDHYVVKRAA